MEKRNTSKEKKKRNKGFPYKSKIKKGQSNIVNISLFIIIVLIIILVNIFLWYPDYKEYKVYKNFCDDKPDFCYCSFFEGCEFKTQTSQKCINGNCDELLLSDNTLELCKLAEELNDKEILFKVGCNLE